MADAKTAMTGAQRVKRANDKKKEAGLMQIKVWVIDQRGDDLNGVKSEADSIRKYAANQPLTKIISGSLS